MVYSITHSMAYLCKTQFKNTSNYISQNYSNIYIHYVAAFRILTGVRLKYNKFTLFSYDICESKLPSSPHYNRRSNQSNYFMFEIQNIIFGIGPLPVLSRFVHNIDPYLRFTDFSDFTREFTCVVSHNYPVTNPRI